MNIKHHEFNKDPVGVELTAQKILNTIISDSEVDHTFLTLWNALENCNPGGMHALAVVAILTLMRQKELSGGKVKHAKVRQINMVEGKYLHCKDMLNEVASEELQFQITKLWDDMREANSSQTMIIGATLAGLLYHCSGMAGKDYERRMRDRGEQ